MNATKIAYPGSGLIILGHSLGGALVKNNYTLIDKYLLIKNKAIHAAIDLFGYMDISLTYTFG